MKKQKLLLMGQLPPPIHGQAVATKMLFDHEWSDFDVQRLKMDYSNELEEVGQFRWNKIKRLWVLIRKARVYLKKNPDAILFYPPASAKWTPFLRDVVFLWATRRLAWKTAFIFHAGGLPTFIKASIVRRTLSKLCYEKPDLSFEVAHEEESPHQYFQARNWRWCPCAIEVPRVERVELPNNKPLGVLFVGSLCEGKGVLMVLKTAQELKNLGQLQNFSFRIAGRWASEEFRVEAMRYLADHDLEESVDFIGEISGKQKWETYKDADVFFFPSHYESEASPIVLMEALGSGLPIVATKWRGIPTLLDGFEGANILPIRSPEAYANALTSIDENKVSLGKLGGDARSVYEEKFLPSHFISRIETGLLEMEEDDRDVVIMRKELRKSSRKKSKSSEDPKVRALQVFNQYYDKGGEEVWANRMLRSGDEDLSIYDLRFSGKSWKTARGFYRFRQLALTWDNPISRAILRERVESNPIDILIFHNLIPIGSLGLYDEARDLEIPVLQYIHNFRPFSPSGSLWSNGKICKGALLGNDWEEIKGGAWNGSRIKTFILSCMFKKLRKSGRLDAVDRWLAVSDFMRECFIQAGFPAEKVVTLRHCWRVTSDLSRVEDKGYYLFLGRLVPEKGLSTLIEVWKNLYESQGMQAPKLVIAGTGSEESKIIRAMADNPLIQYKGFVSGAIKRDLLEKCRGLLAPSLWWEPLGLIAYEAFEYEKPVLAAKSGGLTEILEQSGGGYIHEPGNIQQLASDVMKLENIGCDGRLALGRKGREWLISSASPDKWRESLKKIILEVKEERGKEQSVALN